MTHANQNTFDPLPSGAMGRFAVGLRAPWEGFLFLMKHPGLWRYALISIALSLIISLLILGGLIWTGVWFVQYLHPMFAGAWYMFPLEIVCGIAIFALALGGAFIAFLLLKGILCDYFNEILAEKVEIILGMNPEDIRSAPFLYHVIDAGRDVVFLVAVNLGLLLMNIVPIAGSAVGFFASLYYDCLTFGADYLDFPLNLRGILPADKRIFIREHRAPALGLGVTAFVGALIPLLGAILLATATVGAVLLHRRAIAKNTSNQIEPATELHNK
jgi:CysZ protein